MQDCFREHPDVYAEELAETEDDFDEGELVSGKPIPDGTAGDQPTLAKSSAKEATIESKQEDRNKDEPPKTVEDINSK
jgi:hypothetical protein